MTVRGRSLGEKMSEYLVKRIEASATLDEHAIEVLTRTEVVGCSGDERLKGLTLRHADTGETRQVATGALFVFIGASPRTSWLDGLLARDPHGFILTGPDLDTERDLAQWPMKRAPYLLEASVPGIFAAGDVRHDSVKRVASAVGEGSVSVHLIHRYLATL
jgi:thioredoxin reductase (NADPH)